MKNKINYVIISLALTTFFAMPVFALQFVSGNIELTVDPNAVPQVDEDYFDIAGELAAWIDSRDDVNSGPQVFATLVNDPCHTEYAIDVNTMGTQMIKVDDDKIIYNTTHPVTENAMIRIANVNDINNPVIEDINIGQVVVLGIDVDDGVVVYEAGYSPLKIYTFSLNDPCRAQYLIEDVNSVIDEIRTNISINGNLVSWSGSLYDPGMGQDNNYLAVADISDPNNPVVTKTFLPYAGGSQMELQSVDTSGEWLVGNSNFANTSMVLAIRNYYDNDVNNWEIVEVFQSGAFGNSSPRIDEPFVVWVTNSNYYNSSLSYPGSTGSDLMGALLLDNNRAVASVLRLGSDPNITMYHAELSGNNVVWTELFSSQSAEYYDLYDNNLEISCGDWGYSPADLDHDCDVDFKDFAAFAQRWLNCTTPYDSDCVFGQIWQVGDNLFESDL